MTSRFVGNATTWSTVRSQHAHVTATSPPAPARGAARRTIIPQSRYTSVACCESWPASAWSSGRLVGFDIETTGLDRELDEPVSFAFVEFDGGERRAVETGFVLPARAISRGAAAVHGLTRERLGQARGDRTCTRRRGGSRRASPSLSASGTPVVGCNLTYDLTIVDRVLSRLDPPTSLRAVGWVGPVLDVLVLDRGLDARLRRPAGPAPRRAVRALRAHGPPAHRGERRGGRGARGPRPGEALRRGSRTARSTRSRPAGGVARRVVRRVRASGARTGRPSLFSDSEPWPYAERVAAR